LVRVPAGFGRAGLASNRPVMPGVRHRCRRIVRGRPRRPGVLPAVPLYRDIPR
jgi:hypothetical protein